jgi:Ni,Fe-hydrogenase III small subunit
MRKTLLRSLFRRPLTEPPPRVDDSALTELAGRLDRSARRSLGRSLSIREVDAGSCNGCELEIHALNNAFYDLERFGIRFVASPRHADVLLVTGPVTANMRLALECTYRATPDPKWVVAVGDCALDGGLFAGSDAVVGGVSAVVPVDLHIHGCPPSPRQLLEGLLALLAASGGGESLAWSSTKSASSPVNRRPDQPRQATSRRTASATSSIAPLRAAEGKAYIAVAASQRPAVYSVLAARPKPRGSVAAAQVSGLLCSPAGQAMALTRPRRWAGTAS